MSEQVTLSGGLAPGVSMATQAIPAPRAPGSSRPAKSAESRAPEPNQPPEAALAEVNQHLQKAGSELKIQVDHDTGHTVFKVINPGSGEVILQVPSAEMLALARNVRSLEHRKGGAGVLVDKEG